MSHDDDCELCAINARKLYAAEAAIERVRALHHPNAGARYVEPNGGGVFTPCDECEDDYPCATIRTLDGAA